MTRIDKVWKRLDKYGQIVLPKRTKVIEQEAISQANPEGAICMAHQDWNMLKLRPLTRCTSLCSGLKSTCHDLTLTFAVYTPAVHTIACGLICSRKHRLRRSDSHGAYSYIRPAWHKAPIDLYNDCDRLFLTGLHHDFAQLLSLFPWSPKCMLVLVCLSQLLTLSSGNQMRPCWWLPSSVSSTPMPSHSTKRTETQTWTKKAEAKTAKDGGVMWHCVWHILALCDFVIAVPWLLNSVQCTGMKFHVRAIKELA